MQGSPTHQQGMLRPQQLGYPGSVIKEEPEEFLTGSGCFAPGPGSHLAMAAAGGVMPGVGMALKRRVSSEELGGFQGISLKDSLDVADSNLPQPALTVLDGDMYGSPLASSGGTGASKHRGKRNQVWRACLPCRKLKIRCDEERPCQRCVEKGVADSCVSWDNGGTVRRACQACQRSKLRCDRNRPCERCIKRRIADNCCADDGEDPPITSSPLMGSGAQQPSMSIVFSRLVSLEQQSSASAVIDLDHFCVKYNWDMGMSADLIANIFASLSLKLRNVVALSATWMRQLKSSGGEDDKGPVDLVSWDDVTTVGFCRMTWDPVSKLRQGMYANRQMAVIYGMEHADFLSQVADCSNGLSTSRSDWLVGFLEDTICFLHGVRKYKRFFRTDSLQFPVLILEHNFGVDHLGRPTSVSQIWRHATLGDFENETAQQTFDGKFGHGDRLFAKKWEALPCFVTGAIGGADKVALLSLKEDLEHELDGLIEEFCNLVMPFQSSPAHISGVSPGDVGMQAGAHHGDGIQQLASNEAHAPHDVQQMQQHADQVGAWGAPHTNIDLFSGGPPSSAFQNFMPDSMGFSRTQSDPGAFVHPPQQQVFVPSFEPSGFSRTQSDPGAFAHHAFQGSNSSQGQAVRPLLQPPSFTPAAPLSDWSQLKDLPHNPSSEVNNEASRPLSRAGSDPGGHLQEQHSPMHKDSGFSRTHSDPGAFFSHPPQQTGFAHGGWRAPGAGMPFQFGYCDNSGGFSRKQSAPMEFNTHPAYLSTAETVEATPFTRSASTHGEAAAAGGHHQQGDFAHIFAAHQPSVNDNPFSRTQSEPGSGAFSRFQPLQEPNTHDLFQEHTSSFVFSQPQQLQPPSSSGQRRNTLGGFQSQPFVFRTQSDQAVGFPFKLPSFGNQQDFESGLDLKPQHNTVNYGLMDLLGHPQEVSAKKKRSSLEFTETSVGPGGHGCGHVHAESHATFDDILTTDPVEQLAMTQKRNSDENISNGGNSSMSAPAFDPLSTGDTRKKCRKMWSGDWSPE